MIEQLIIDISKYGDRLLIAPDEVMLFCGDIWGAKSLQRTRNCIDLATVFWVEGNLIWCFCKKCINFQTLRLDLGREITDENEVRSILCIMQVNGS